MDTIRTYKRWLVALGGDLPGAELLRGLLNPATGLAAADGAAGLLLQYGLVPHVVIGDMDSAPPELLEDLRRCGVLVGHIGGQDDNDFGKALEWVLAYGGAAEAVIVGAFGGMSDHALNNVSVMAKFARRLRLSLRDDASVAYLMPGSLNLRLDTRPGERISLIPLPRARLATTGLQWNLDGDVLELGVAEGGSNRATGHSVAITVQEGLALAWHYPHQPSAGT